MGKSPSKERDCDPFPIPQISNLLVAWGFAGSFLLLLLPLPRVYFVERGAGREGDERRGEKKKRRDGVTKDKKMCENQEDV